MNQRKQNISRWCALGLAAVLMIGGLVLAVSTTQARYRTEYENHYLFETRKPAEIYLGTWDAGKDAFDSTARGSWEQTEDGLQLEFVVANGVDAGNYDAQTQTVCVRLIASLGIQPGENPPVIQLIDPLKQTAAPESDPEEGTEATEPKETGVYIGQPIQITENSLLYESVGPGWVYHFVDENGREVRWTLEGGQLSHAALTLCIPVEEDTVFDTSFVQLQVIGETMD